MIQSIVFDIGHVFVDLRPEPLLRLLSSYGGGTLSLADVVTRTHLADHEAGRFSGQTLLENLAALAPEPIPLDELRAKWLDMFHLHTSMVDFAHTLAQRYRVYLLSNVGDLHWTHLSREYGLHRLGHGVLPSFIAGVGKPDPGIFAQAERRFGLAPAATVLVDDRAENVAAARERGWHAIEHRSERDTRAAMRALGIDGA